MTTLLADPSRLSRADRGLVLFTASFGGFLVTFLSSGINVALPLIGDEFHVSAVTLSWMSASYILVAASLLLPMGRVADMFGRKRMFIWGMVIFVAFSLGSAFAPSAPVLLALRALHGIGLAVGSVTSVALVSLAYPAEVRGRALGICTAAIYLGLTIGPVLGGFIVHNLGWRSMFLIVGGLALVNVALPLWRLRHVEWRESHTTRFDYVGGLAYAISLTAVLVGFSTLPGVAGAVLIPAGIVGLALFLLWESRVTDPLLNVGLLRHSRVFAFSNVATLVAYARQLGDALSHEPLSAVQPGPERPEGRTGTCDRHLRSGARGSPWPAAWPTGCRPATLPPPAWPYRCSACWASALSARTRRTGTSSPCSACSAPA